MKRLYLEKSESYGARHERLISDRDQKLDEAKILEIQPQARKRGVKLEVKVQSQMKTCKNLFKAQSPLVSTRIRGF